MKVKELIQILSSKNPEALVVVNDHGDNRVLESGDIVEYPYVTLDPDALEDLGFDPTDDSVEDEKVVFPHGVISIDTFS